MIASDGGGDERRRKRQWAREHRADNTSLGDELPEVANPGRKALCRSDLHLFLQWYFPHSTGMGPFGAPQMQLIDRFAMACRHPSRFLSVLSRGFVKTTVSVHALLWAGLYGHSQNSVFLAANAALASNAVESIKRELLGNDLLHEDFPEVTVSLRALNNTHHRAKSQTFNGVLTCPEWKKDTIVFPTLEGSPSSGCIIQSKGLEAASRGLSYKRLDGFNVRPTVVVIDDAQTDKSAKSAKEIQKRSDIIRKGVARLGGHGSKSSVIINGTPLQPDDLIEQLCDRKLHPGWSKTRCPMVPQLPTEEELQVHWLGPYARILTNFDDDNIESQERAEKAATEYYKQHRDAMDAGFEVAWWSIPLEKNEISAIQHAMNIAILEGWDVFMAECQLSPLKPTVSSTLQIDISVAKRTSNYARFVVPLTAQHLVFGVDVHDEILYYAVAAVASDFTGYVIDYGTHPDQKSNFFTHATVKRTLSREYPGESPERCIELGVEDLVYRLLHEIFRTPNGDAVPITNGLVDVGYKPVAVANALRRLLPSSQVVLMAKGIGIGPDQKPMVDYDLDIKKVFRCGPDKKRPRWIMPVSGRDGQLVRVDSDTNYWADVTAARFVQSADVARWQLFGGAGDDHSMIAAHLTCMAPFLKAGSKSGRSVNVWDYAGSSRDNHYWDCVVQCALAASISGAEVPGVIRTVEVPIKTVKASEIIAQRRAERRP